MKTTDLDMLSTFSPYMHLYVHSSSQTKKVSALLIASDFLIPGFVVPGERYDVVISADQPVSNYWIRAVGLRDCAFTNGTAAAILKYEGAPEEEPSGDYLVYTPGSVSCLSW